MALRKDQKEKVHQRLLEWADASSEGFGLVGSLGSSAMHDHVPNDFGFRSLWSAQVEEVERAVLALAELEREVIKEHYLQVDSSVTQSCSHLRISSSEYYRRRDAAMEQIYHALDCNKRLVANY